MDEDTTYIILQTSNKRYITLEIGLKSFVNYNDLPNIIASRSKKGKIKPWVPQEENSVYICTPKNAVFITNTVKLKTILKPGNNKIQLPDKSLVSNIIEPYVSWHGKAGTLSVKGIKDSTLVKQTPKEYSSDIVSSINRDDLADQQVCILEVVIPINANSYQEIKGYKNYMRRSISPFGNMPDHETGSFIIEHPTDIILNDSNLNNKYVSLLFFVHIGTRLRDDTIKRVKEELVCAPITITNSGYKGSVNCSILVRTLGELPHNNTLPILFSIKSTNLNQQIFFEAYKY